MAGAKSLWPGEIPYGATLRSRPATRRENERGVCSLRTPGKQLAHVTSSASDVDVPTLRTAGTRNPVCRKSIETSYLPVFLASQNPLLFDYLVFESAEDISRSCLRCQRDDNGKFSIANLDETTATKLYKIYSANVLHVSEIFRNLGLW